MILPVIDQWAYEQHQKLGRMIDEYTTKLKRDIEESNIRAQGLFVARKAITVLGLTAAYGLFFFQGFWLGISKIVAISASIVWILIKAALKIEEVTMRKSRAMKIETIETMENELNELSRRSVLGSGYKN